MHSFGNTNTSLNLQIGLKWKKECLSTLLKYEASLTEKKPGQSNVSIKKVMF